MFVFEIAAMTIIIGLLTNFGGLGSNSSEILLMTGKHVFTLLTLCYQRSSTFGQ